MKTYLTILASFLFTVITGQTEIYFDSGKSTLTSESILVLDSLLNELTENDAISINGHTDTIGSSESNIVLSQKRAKSVEQYIEKVKVLAPIEIIASGENAPKYKDNKHNRRVEITITKAKTVIAEETITEVSTIEETTTEIIKPKNSQLTVEQFLTEDNINLKNIQFKPGTPYFYDSTAIEELYQLAFILDSLKSIKIKVEGHVCCTNDQKLSELRAIAVCDFLNDKGISKDRLGYIGYSNSRPLVPETSAYNNQQNRRVEVSIVER